jgi:hypothetical protein
MRVLASCSSTFPWSDGAPGRILSSLAIASRGALIGLIRSSNVALACVSIRKQERMRKKNLTGCVKLTVGTGWLCGSSISLG